MNPLPKIGRQPAAVATLFAASLLASSVAEAQQQPDHPVATGALPFGDVASAGGAIVATVGLIFALIGFAIAAVTMMRRRRAEAAAGWPRALATIESSGVVEKTDRDFDDRSQTQYVPAVRYSYEVAGQAYTGTRIRVSEPAFARRSKAEEIAARYRPAAQVSLRYDPADPASAVLETVKPSIGPAMFGGVFLALGVLILLAGLGAF